MPDGAFEILFSALPQSFIIDWDSTVTTRYGEQKGAEVGYNPMKPGRVTSAYRNAGLRMCLTLSQRPGNSHTADGMTEAFEAESNKPYYVFTLKKSAKVMEGDTSSY